MIKDLKVVAYRKLKGIDFSFVQNVNVISGVNGTCKSSLLHIVSNAFQQVRQNTQDVSDASCIRIISKLNALINPKIEALTRGDKNHSDPANGHKGTLFSIIYENGLSLDFRRHNSEGANRYAVKPKYTKGTQDKLPTLPVIYLGLPRLFPFGEVSDEQKDGPKITTVKEQLPPQYLTELTSLYNELMAIEIRDTHWQNLNGFKKRGDFATTKEGVDSNTISSGEDNIFVILLALVSLRYYYDSLKEKSGHSESILLIDEFDATLHPSLQWRLMRKMREYSRKYGIQIIVSTHSLSLIEECLRFKDNVIYLVDNNGTIGIMPDPDKYKIEAKLKTLSMSEVYADRKIPLFLEDKEAHKFLEEIFDYYQDTYDKEFATVRNCFEFVDETFGADTLKKLFKNHIVSGAIHGICILDGDQQFSSEREMLANSSAILPGEDSPEKVLFRFAEDLYNNPNDDFWTDAAVASEAFDCTYYEVNIRPRNNELIKGDGEEKKPLRERTKEHFNSYIVFYTMVLKRMLREKSMQPQILAFMKVLNVLFKKNADFHRISSSRWTFNKLGG